MNRLPFYGAARTQAGALLGATTLLALGDISAKVLAFVFFVVLARFVTAAEYGTFRFGLTLGYLGAVPAAALALTLMHFLPTHDSAPKGRPIQAIMTLSLVGTAAGIFLAAAAAPSGTAIMTGTALMILGLSFANTYLGINKGTLEFGKAAAYPALSNFVQLLPIIVSAFWFPQYLLVVAMASYGLSYFVTLLPLEWIKPTKARLSLGRSSSAEYGTALRFATPLFFSHGSYQLLFGLDLIWLQLFASAEFVGYYAAAKVLATAYTVFPNALYSVLMPKISAEGAGQAARRSLKLALALTLVTNGCLILLFGLTGSLLLEHLFGAGYAAAAPALFVIGIGMLFYSLCSLLNANATGSGVPLLQGMTMLAGLAAAVMVGPFLTVQYGMLGASASFAFGTFVAFLVASFWTRRHISW